MEGFLLVGVIIFVVVVFLILSKFGKDPSRKTNAMLERELDLHDRVIANSDVGSSSYFRQLEARKRVSDELERRSAAERKSGVSENSELTDGEIRKLVTAGYEEGWRRSKLKQKDDEDAHETALLSGLLGRISGPNEWSSIPHEIAQAIMMETLPFKFSGTHAEGRLALIEYAVWREVPSEADAALVQRSVTAMVEHMKNSGDTDFLLSVKKMPLPWIKLLPEG